MFRPVAGTAAAMGVDAGTDGGSRGGDGTVRRRLGRQPERAEQAPHGVGLGHRTEDSPRATAARTNQDLEHPLQAPAAARWPAARRPGKEPARGR
jgi:hypothetical protein